MGPAKRLINIMKAARDAGFPEEAPQVTYLHTEWKRGDKQ